MGKRNKYSCIYVLVSPLNEVYVGQTTDLINRRSRYKTLTCKNQTKVFESLSRFGFDSHRLQILKSFGVNPGRETLDFWETFYYRLFESAGYKLMNLKSAGWNGKPCEESISRLSQAHKGQTAWNKGLKGAQEAWNKGLKKHQYADR